VGKQPISRRATRVTCRNYQSAGDEEVVAERAGISAMLLGGLWHGIGGGGEVEKNSGED